MFRSKGAGGKVTSNNLLKRLLLEMGTLGELLTFRSSRESRRTFPRGQVYEFAPIGLRSRRLVRSESASQPFRRRTQPPIG
jgi:hypothetical protein